MGVFKPDRRQLLGAICASALVLLTGLEPALRLVANHEGTPWTVSPRQAHAAPGDPFLWAVGGPGADEARHLAVDGGGNVYLAGMLSAGIDVDPGPASDNLTSAGGSDLFLAKYGPGGDVVWAFGVGGTGVDQVYQVAVDPWGNVLFAGRFFGADVNFDGVGGAAILTSAGQSDGFVAKYGPDGALLRR